jgi:hypothetical protein
MGGSDGGLSDGCILGDAIVRDSEGTLSIGSMFDIEAPLLVRRCRPTKLSLLMKPRLSSPSSSSFSFPSSLPFSFPFPFVCSFALNRMGLGVDCFLSLSFVKPFSRRSSVLAASFLAFGVVYDACLREGGDRNVEGEGVCIDIGRLEADFFNASLSDSSSRIFPLSGRPFDRKPFRNCTNPKLFRFGSLRESELSSFS